MAKPFKSEFDLMAEAYATVKYDKQQLINEDKAGRRVIGYPPQIVEEGDVNKRIHQDASNGMRKAELEQAYGPEAVEAYISWGHANGVFEGEPFEDAEDKPKIDYGPSGEGTEVHPDEAAENTIWDMDVYTQEQEEPIRVKSSSESEVEAEFAAKGLTVTQILYPEPGFSDGSDSPDNEQYPEPGVEDAETAAGGNFKNSVVFQLEGPLSMGVNILARNVNQAEAGLSGRHETEEVNGMVLLSDDDGKGILFYNGRELDQTGLENALKAFDNAEDAENPMHARLDGMIDQDLLVVAQNALQEILDDLHRHGEDFDGAEVGGFVGKFLG